MHNCRETLVCSWIYYICQFLGDVLGLAIQSYDPNRVVPPDG